MEDFVGENSLKRIAPIAVRAMQEAIEEAGGREVFFVGIPDTTGRVGEVRVSARGHATAVPALFQGLKAREIVLHNHPSGDLEPSEADLDLASIYSAHGHGVFIVDNAVTRVYVVIEPFLPDVSTPLALEEMRQAFAPAGDLARSLPQYEVRSQQTRMVEAVAEAFNRDGVAVVEAPTGVGKTMAYLLPAVLWAVRNKERVVVSTRTINLQEQIMHKDVPLLQRALKEKFSCCLVKGRSNYVCLRRFERAFSEASLFDDADLKAQLHALGEWIEKTEDGSKADLPFVPDRELWGRVCSEADSCNLGRCPDPKKCFVGRARREVARADVIVTNHHLLFSDIAIKREVGDFNALAVLPSYKRVIFDEAHNIEDSATEYFGVAATQIGALATFSRFFRTERGRERGLVPLIALKLMRECPQVSVPEYEALQKLLYDRLLPELSTAREATIQAFAAIRDVTAQRCGQIGRDIKWRLTLEVLAMPQVRRTHEQYVLPAVHALRDFVKIAGEVLGKLERIQPTEDQRESPLTTEIMQFAAYRQRLETLANTLAESTSEELQPNTVRWIEIDAKVDTSVRIARCPLEVGKPLAEWVYENLKTVVMTSATLTVQQEFRYFFERLGLDLLDSNRIETIMLDSPFDFEHQAMLCIPSDMPDPADPKFQDDTVECLRLTLEITRGHAFVLFTSFVALEYAYRRLANWLQAQGITPLQQGQATRTQLLDRFRSEPSSVLFATDSFWEGVDVAGDALQCVILPKLPFRVPTEPILQARAEAIEAAGGNAFTQYSVPQAVIKFRQGFGRLIRRRSDRGVVIVLDRRILTKYYGKTFLRSLPDLKVVKGPRRGVFMALQQFFERNEEE